MAGGAARVVDRDGRAVYEPGYLGPAEADALLQTLLRETPWRSERVVLFGRAVDVPRRTAWYGDPGASYTYSGLRNEPLPWTPALAAVRDRLLRTHGARFDSVLLNLYRDGRDAMGRHADDEDELGHDPLIASLSLGAARTFRLRHRDDGERVDVELEHGSLLVMSGALQHRWVHEVPRRRAVRGPRINLTFRCVLGARSPGPVRRAPCAK